MPHEHLGEGFGEVLYQMQTVRDLRRGGYPLAHALGIRTGPIPRDDLYPRVCLEPLRHRLGRAVRQQRHGLVALQVHEDGAIGVPSAQGEIIHAQHGRGGGRGDGLLAQQMQQRLSAHGAAPALPEAHPGLAA
jgi:hypothetical protein